MSAQLVGIDVPAAAKAGRQPLAVRMIGIVAGVVHKIADEAAKSSRIGARALKSIYGRIIKPFEFDPFSREEVQPLNGDGGPHRLVIDDKLVSEALKPAV